MQAPPGRQRRSIDSWSCLRIDFLLVKDVQVNVLFLSLSPATKSIRCLEKCKKVVRLLVNVKGLSLGHAETQNSPILGFEFDLSRLGFAGNYSVHFV